MKKIPLTKNKFALVDDEDYEWLNQWRWWFLGGYAGRVRVINGVREAIYMHRLINNTPIGKFTDHINGNKLDNKKLNLRTCTIQENARNMRKTHGTSAYKGVHWSSRHKTWKATLNKYGQVIFIGYFKNERHAALAYDLWAIDMWGSFANVNFKTIAKNHEEIDYGPEPEESDWIMEETEKAYRDKANFTESSQEEIK